MIQPALIIFDIDGTLLQSEQVTVPAVQETFAAFGLPKPDKAAICSFFGRPVEEYEAWLAERCPPERAAEIVEATNRRELELIGESGRLYPGTRYALADLKKAGHRLAIYSNGPGAYVEEFLDAHRVRDFFEAVCARGAKYTGKEAMIAAILEQIPVRPAIVVGDRHDDVESAHAHGAVAIAVTYGFGSPEELEEADAQITSVTQLPGTVRKLLARQGGL